MAIKNTAVVGVVVINNQGQLLLQQRSDDQTWCIPGGGIAIGETTEEAVKRELLEETGLEMTELALYKVFSGSSQYHVYPDGNAYYFINIVYRCLGYQGEVTIGDAESLAVAFFDLDYMPEKIAKTNIPIIESIKRDFSM